MCAVIADWLTAFVDVVKRLPCCPASGINYDALMAVCGRDSAAVGAPIPWASTAGVAKTTKAAKGSRRATTTASEDSENADPEPTTKKSAAAKTRTRAGAVTSPDVIAANPGVAGTWSAETAILLCGCLIAVSRSLITCAAKPAGRRQLASKNVNTAFSPKMKARVGRPAPNGRPTRARRIIRDEHDDDDVGTTEEQALEEAPASHDATVDDHDDDDKGGHTDYEVDRSVLDDTNGDEVRVFMDGGTLG